MRILHVNKFLYRRGGAESYLLELAGKQREAGHEVEYFAMQHPENLASAYSHWFPSYVQTEPPPVTLPGKVGGAGRVLYSPAARRGMVGVLDEFMPEVVHLHNIYHQLSPSILGPLAARSVPAVMTLHDYKLACPTYRFLDHGRICEACVGGHWLQPVRRRCNRGSLAASGLNAFEAWLHSTLRSYDPVHLFLCPSRFLAGKMTEAGVYPNRMRHLPHFVEVPDPAPGNRGTTGRVAYVGRLANEKGIDVLIRASARAGVGVDIAGDGPELDALQALAAAVSPGAVSFLGRLDREEVNALIGRSLATVLPARWYENQPLAILESLACGTPAVGTSLGGIAELIDDCVDGFLVPPDDSGALADRLSQLAADRDMARRMGEAGRAKVRRDFSPAVHLSRLAELYEQAAALSGTPSAGAT